MKRASGGERRDAARIGGDVKSSSTRATRVSPRLPLTQSACAGHLDRLLFTPLDLDPNPPCEPAAMLSRSPLAPSSSRGTSAPTPPGPAYILRGHNAPVSVLSFSRCARYLMSGCAHPRPFLLGARMD